MEDNTSVDFQWVDGAITTLVAASFSLGFGNTIVGGKLLIHLSF